MVLVYPVGSLQNLSAYSFSCFTASSPELLDFPMNCFSSFPWWYRSGTLTIARDCRVLWQLSKSECVGWRITPGPEAPLPHLRDTPARRAPEKQGLGTGGLDPRAEGHGPQGQANRKYGNSVGNNLWMWGPGYSWYLLLAMSVHHLFRMSLLCYYLYFFFFF